MARGAVTSNHIQGGGSNSYLKGGVNSNIMGGSNCSNPIGEKAVTSNHTEREGVASNQ